MREWVETAERLRQVRKAHERFLALWAAECLLDRRQAFEQIATDAAADQPQQDFDTPLADPFNHDWSLLYKGSVLDD